MNNALVSLHDVSFSYAPDRPVLAGCNFQLAPQERVGLIGPNGSGKTTLLALIVGLLRPTSGRVEVFGKVRATETDFHEVRGRAGLLFQNADDQLFCPTVLEDVAFGPMNLGKPRREARRIVGQTLDSLGLAGYEDRLTHRLSGGEKKLVALATVLAMQPEVLLLDEPTSGLDDEATHRVTEILAHLPHAMLIVSHDRALLDTISTASFSLSNGQLKPADSATLDDHPPKG